MKTRQDTENRLLAELKQWSIKQARDIYADYYLYYMTTTPEHDGGLLICRSDLTPNYPDYQLAMLTRINKSSSVQQNFNYIRLNVLGSLPILSID